MLSHFVRQPTLLKPMMTFASFQTMFIFGGLSQGMPIPSISKNVEQILNHNLSTTETSELWTTNLHLWNTDAAL